MSAPQRASETPSTANPFLRDLVASLRTVVVPGSSATYANRTILKDLGLRWDPANHRGHGTTTTERVKELRELLHLDVRVFGPLETVGAAMTVGSAAIIVSAISSTGSLETLGTSMIALGALELLLGTFLAYVLYPTFIVAVALASLLTLGVGVAISADGRGLARPVGIACVAVGLLCASVGGFRAVTIWNRIARYV